MFKGYAGHLSAHLASIFIPIISLSSAKPTSHSQLRLISLIALAKLPIQNCIGDIAILRYIDLFVSMDVTPDFFSDKGYIKFMNCFNKKLFIWRNNVSKFYILLLSVIFLGCENSRIPFEYIETQLQRFEEIGARELNLQMPISGNIEILLLEHNLLKGNNENENIQLPLTITADFTFMTARDFTISFSNGLGGYPFTVNGTDSTLTVKNNDGIIIDIPVDVLRSAADEYVAYEMSAEVNQYLWGIECILTHLFPLTKGWKVHQDILDEKSQSDYIIVSSNEESEIDYLEMTFVFNKLKRRYVTQLIDMNPVLFIRGETGFENIRAITYHDYVIWDSDKNWLFPTIVGDLDSNNKHTSTLKSISSPNIHE